MQQTFKTFHPLKWMIPVLAAVTLFISCNNAGTKTDTPPADSSSSKMATADTGSSKMKASADTSKPVKDTLPPLDTTVKHRPENIKARKP